MKQYETLYTTLLGANKVDALSLHFPAPESDLEAFYSRKGRYAIMSADDLYVFGDTHQHHREAVDAAEELAQLNPGRKYIVFYLDTTVVAEVPVKPQLIKRTPLV